MTATPEPKKQSQVPLIAAIVVGIAVAVGTYFVGQNIGYKHGYDVAYTSEHSHYMFEKTRGDKMQKRITMQGTCIKRVIGMMQPVTDSGLAAIGEIMGNVKIYVGGSAECDRESNFAAVTSAQWQHVMGQSEN